MEASEKHQLALGESPDGSVRALGDRIVIENLTVTDERSAQLVRDRTEAGHDPVATIRNAIEVGARVIDRESDAIEVDYVRREFEKVAGESRTALVESSRQVVEQIEARFAEAFGEEGGALAKTLDGFEEELAEQIASSFDADRAGAVPNQIKEIVAKLVEERMQGLIKHFSSSDGSNPLADFKVSVTDAVKTQIKRQDSHHEAMQERLSKLQAELARLTEQNESKKHLAEAEAAGTRKGFTFEALVHGGLERIAEARGDAALHTGAQLTETGGKKGDSVVEIGAGEGQCRARVVFEAKDKKLSKPEAWRELDAALDQRGAEFAVLVVAGEENVPSGRESLTEYEGNKMVVAVDRDDPTGTALEYAYRYARARALMSGDQELSVDAAGVRDAAEKARNQLKDLQKARRSLTSIENSVEDVRGTVNSIDQAIKLELDRIESLVAPAEAEVE